MHIRVNKKSWFDEGRSYFTREKEYHDVLITCHSVLINQ